MIAEPPAALPVAQTDALLGFHRASKRYGSTLALSDVSLTVERGQFVVLLGPSGSGKSTMLRCAAGVERLSGGQLRLDGEVIDNGRDQVPPERRDLAMVFQDYALWPHMTAHQNVAYALKRRRLSPVEVRQRTRDMLERVGLGKLAERYPSELSGGEQQRVALARAMVASPRLLLFDEPLSNLDANLRDRMRVEIALLVREVGATALYITHDQAEAFALADRVGILNRGELVQFGSPQDIYSSPATPFVARLTGLSGELRGLLTAPPIDRLATVQVANVAVTGRPVNGVSAGPVSVLIRPAAVQLEAPHHEREQIRAAVRDVAFCGRGYEHLIQLSDGTLLSSIFSEQRWDRGEHVAVALSPSGCLVFPTQD